MIYKRAILACMIAIAAGLGNPSNVLADTIIELGVHVGGGELVNEAFTNGQSDSIKAGGLFSFDFGRLYHISPTWESQFTFGVKSDARYDNDLKVSWVRYPLNGILFYRMTGMRVGLGATYHFSPTLKGDGQAGNINEKFEDAIGGLLELDLIRSERFLWGIRLTFIQYESRRDQHVVDGNSIGFLIIAQL